MAYKSKFTGDTIDGAINRVIDGSVVVENTLSALDETSNKPVNSRAVAEAITQLGSEVEKEKTFNGAECPDAEFAISDENNYDIARFDNGHIKTKNFDSARTAIIDGDEADFAVTDENNNKILEVSDGHIRTKNFNSARVGTTLPLYYDTYLVDIANTMNAELLKCSKEAVAFFFLTDTHVSSNTLMSGKIIKYLQENTPINIVFWGGDAIEAYGTKAALDKSIKLQDKYLKDCRILGRLFNIRGNHDYLIMNSASDQNNGYMYADKTTNHILQYANKGVVYDEENPDNYYYVDDKIANIRYIVLDTTEHKKEGTSFEGNIINGFGASVSKYSERQLKQWDWLFNTALDTTMNVIILSHIPLSLICSSSGNANYGLREHLRAYQNRRVYGGVDYSNATANIIAVIGGHEHVDSQEVNDGILHVETSCDAYPNDDESTINACIATQTGERGKGTIYEQLLDVYIVDAGNKIVKTIRIGGGRNRYMHTNTITLSVGETYQLSPDYVQAVRFVSYNEGNHDNTDDVWPSWSGRTLTLPNDRVSVSDTGLVTALKTGGGNVVAVSANNEIELFYIKIK